MTLAALWALARSKLAGYLAAIGAVLAVLFAAYSKGKTDAAVKQTEQRLENIETARKVEDEVDRLDPDGVDDRLGKWMRDK
ncbi:hypothetical protein QBK99_12650 [Corticibacterium sp. UT-5YL-CI-8]|nr:hypothetical protein [Tianweitania sp. UT-5YL-CI-8]